jgi:hypothetical protein
MKKNLSKCKFFLDKKSKMVYPTINNTFRALKILFKYIVSNIL